MHLFSQKSVKSPHVLYIQKLNMKDSKDYNNIRVKKFEKL